MASVFEQSVEPLSMMQSEYNSDSFDLEDPKPKYHCKGSSCKFTFTDVEQHKKLHPQHKAKTLLCLGDDCNLCVWDLNHREG